MYTQGYPALQMSYFEDQEKLREFLARLNLDADHADALWHAGGKSAAKLAAASQDTLKDLGIPAISADYLKACAGENFATSLPMYVVTPTITLSKPHPTGCDVVCVDCSCDLCRSVRGW
jgi:hypothetical protein